MREEKNSSSRYFCPWLSQLSGRCRVETPSVSRRLEALSSGVHEHLLRVESPSGPFRVRLEQAASPLRQLVPTTQLLESGRVQPIMEGTQCVLFPAVQPDPVLLIEANGGESRSSSSYSVLAGPTLVPAHYGPRRGRSALIASVPRPSDVSIGRESPVGPRQLNPPDRLETLRRRFTENGVSENASSLILSATRKNTNAAYQSAWNSWGDWCAAREKDPLSPCNADIVNFLAEYSVGRSYRTVNVARSAISSTLAVNPGSVGVGADPLVSKLLKGLYNKSPPSSKYSFTWNPDTVLSHFDATAGATLSLLELSRKFVTLLALSTLLRTCEIASIVLDSVVFSDHDLSFTLGKPRKAQHSGPLHRISIAAWQQNVSICPVKCCETYLGRTAALRNTSNSSSLLISTNKPHGPAAVATVGRWIKEQLKAAGIDTSTFTPHSTRGAAASKAASAGVPIQDILDSGHWARESTFARFYHREMVNGPSNSVASSVLRMPPSTSHD